MSDFERDFWLPGNARPQAPMPPKYGGDEENELFDMMRKCWTDIDLHEKRETIHKLMRDNDALQGAFLAFRTVLNNRSDSKDYIRKGRYALVSGFDKRTKKREFVFVTLSTAVAVRDMLNNRDEMKDKIEDRVKRNKESYENPKEGIEFLKKRLKMKK